MRLETPPRFDFERTLYSHGWFTLAPFEVHDEGRWIETVVPLPEGGARRVRLEPEGQGVRLQIDGSADAIVRGHLRRAARRILNLELDLTPFYRAAREREGMRWIDEYGAGRFLRAPCLFEDLVKLILTTNCSWALTRKMARALVDLYGERAPDGTRSFPRPERLARVRESTLRSRVRAGYRAPHLVSLSRAVARGELDCDAWEHDPRRTGEIKLDLLKLPGAGPYVAENMLRLLGRPDGLGLDSWLRSKYARVYHEGRRVTDRTIARRYARFGQWAGLALWCDMTRDWVNPHGTRVAGIQ